MSDAKPRLDWVDVAKAFGIYTAFATHAMERFWADGYHAMAVPEKYVHSFLMPFFWVVSGFFYKRPDVPFREFLKSRFLRRIVPTGVFLAMALPFYFTGLEITGWNGSVAWGLVLHVFGIPVLSWPSWFMIALFSGEIVLYFVLPRVPTLPAKLVACALLVCTGWGIAEVLTPLHIAIALLASMWFFKQSFIVAAFLLLGIASRPLAVWLTRLRLPAVCAIGVLAAIGSFGTFDLNVPDSPFAGFQVGNEENVTPWRPIVINSLGIYGSLLWYVVPGLLGAVLWMCVARLTPPLRPILWIGRNTLTLIGLNAVFLHFLNDWIFSFFEIPDETGAILFACGAIAVVSVAACVPIVMLLERWVPQLLGRPYESGPLLPALARRPLPAASPARAA